MLRTLIVVVIMAAAVPAQAQSSLARAQSQLAQAQSPVQALTTCLGDATSGKDRKDLAKWIFLAMAAHPEMRQHATGNLATVSDESSKTMAALVTRLLADSCPKETSTVLKSSQGSQAMELAFQGLGQLAMQELMTDPSVQASMAVFERYIDRARLSQAFGK
jgi:hypothetical protein